MINVSHTQHQGTRSVPGGELHLTCYVVWPQKKSNKNLNEEMNFPTLKQNTFLPLWRGREENKMVLSPSFLNISATKGHWSTGLGSSF